MRLRGQIPLKYLVKHGLTVGKYFYRSNTAYIDSAHPYMITIGNNVIVSERAVILAHDASTKIGVKYTKIAPVLIGNNVFVGAGSIILPGVTIGDNCVIGAGSVVTKDCPENSVVAGNPAKVVSSIENYADKHRKYLEVSPKFDNSYRIPVVSYEKILEIKEKVGNKIGYIK